jgi:hypothetical protein
VIVLCSILPDDRDINFSMGVFESVAESDGANRKRVDLETVSLSIKVNFQTDSGGLAFQQ